MRDESDFKEAVKAASGGLIGPRKEPETAAAAVKLLPEDYRKGKDTLGVTESGFVTYKPAFLQFWTWKPAEGTELLVGTIIDDPSHIGQPKGDMNLDYGAIAVLKREEGGKLKLLLTHKTGESPPSVGAGKGNTVVYKFTPMCGDLKGTLSWDGSKVVLKEQTCSEL